MCYLHFEKHAETAVPVCISNEGNLVRCLIKAPDRVHDFDFEFVLLKEILLLKIWQRYFCKQTVTKRLQNRHVSGGLLI